MKLDFFRLVAEFGCACDGDENSLKKMAKLLDEEGREVFQRELNLIKETIE